MYVFVHSYSPNEEHQSNKNSCFSASGIGVLSFQKGQKKNFKPQNCIGTKGDLVNLFIVHNNYRAYIWLSVKITLQPIKDLLKSLILYYIKTVLEKKTESQKPKKWKKVNLNDRLTVFPLFIMTIKKGFGSFRLSVLRHLFHRCGLE